MDNSQLLDRLKQHKEIPVSGGPHLEGCVARKLKKSDMRAVFKDGLAVALANGVDDSLQDMITRRSIYRDGERLFPDDFSFDQLDSADYSAFVEAALKVGGHSENACEELLGNLQRAAESDSSLSDSPAS